MEEANMFKKFANSSNIIHVFDCFYENDTAYYVMEYLDGLDLRNITENYTKIMNFENALYYIKQVMNGLEELHNQGVIHRDISPDNIYITKLGKIKILDFGSARYSLTQKEKKLSVIVKIGYAPSEQYSTKAEQGAWTDIYALCATFYHLLSGVAPPESTERMLNDTLVPLCHLNNNVPKYFSDVISKGLSIKKEDRYLNIPQMRSAMNVTVETCKRNIISKRSAEKPKQIDKDLIKNGVSAVKIKNPTQQDNRKLFLRRICAFVIDSLIYSIIAYFALAVVLEFFSYNNMLNSYVEPVLFWWALGTVVAVILINIIFETSRLQGTLGKIIACIKVVDLNGKTISSKASIIRNLYKFLFLFLLLTEKNNSYVHDRNTNTQVVLRK